MEEDGEATAGLARKQAAADGSILTGKTGMLSAQFVCPGARTNTDFGAELLTKLDAAGGQSEGVAEVCLPAASHMR